MFVLVCGLVMTMALGACGSDGDDGGNKKEFTINGDWMNAYILNGTNIEFYTLNGSSASCVAYVLSGYNVISDNSLNIQNITNITKKVYNGYFTYDKLQLICTFPEGKIEGFVTVHDYEEFVWSIGFSNIEMIRANSKTDALKSQLEQVYQNKYVN